MTNQIQTEISRDSHSRDYHIFYGSNSNGLERIKQLFSSYGIRKVYNTTNPTNFTVLRFTELTLVLSPVLTLMNSTNENVTPYEKFVAFGTYITTTLIPESPVEVSGRRLEHGGHVIADYYEDRNLIICYMKLFTDPIRIKPFKLKLKILMNKINGNVAIKTKNPDNKVEVLARDFSNNVSLQLSKITNEINTIQHNVDNASATIINGERQIMVLNEQKTSLKTFSDNVKESFVTKFNELSELPFLTSYSINNDHIVLDYGDISIKYMNSEHYIGKIKAKIYPNYVRFANSNNAITGENKSVHPHVRVDGSPCFSSFGDDIAKLTARLEFKKLAILIRQFLYTWNPRSPINDINNWPLTKEQYETKKENDKKNLEEAKKKQLKAQQLAKEANELLGLNNQENILTTQLNNTNLTNEQRAEFTRRLVENRRRAITIMNDTPQKKVKPTNRSTTR